MNKIQIPKEIFEGIFLQNGGQVNNKMDIHKALTGDFMTGMDQEKPMQQPNSEIESGEHVQQPGDNVKEVLGDKHSQGGEDVVLEDGAKVLSDHLKIGGVNARKFSKMYDVELKASDTYATVLDKINRKIGLTKLVKEEEEIIKKLDKITKESKDESALGLNTQYLSGKINEIEGSKKSLEKIKEAAFSELFNAQEDSKPKDEKVEPEESFQGGGRKDEQKTPQLSTKDSQERFDYAYNQMVGNGYTGSRNIEELQKWMRANYPDEVVKYFGEHGQPLTAKHVDLLKKNAPWTFKNSGIPSNKASASYTNEEKEKLKSAYSQGDGVNGMLNEDYNNFILEGFNDNKQDWRMPLLSSNVPLKPVTNVNFPKISAPSLPAQNTPAPNNTFIPEDETPEEKVKREAGNNMLLLPSQSPMLPNSLGQSLKLTDRTYQLEKAHISPEQAIQEGNRNQTALIEQINNMPGAQRAAVLAQMSGSQQEAINKAVFDANRYNAQVDATTSNQQAVLDNQSNRMNAQHALSYEQRTQRAQALTDNDLNNYYNTIRANEVRNKREVDQINYDNARNDNFQFDGEKFVQIADTEFGRGSEVYKTPEQRMLEQEELLKASKKLAKTKSRIANAKNGGRFKK